MGKKEHVDAAPPAGAQTVTGGERPPAAARRGWRRRDWRRRGARRRNVVIASVASFLLLPLAFALAAAWDDDWLQGLRGASGAADPAGVRKGTSGRDVGRVPVAGGPGDPAAFPAAGDVFSPEANATLVQVATSLSSDALTSDRSPPLTKLVAGPAGNSAPDDTESSDDGSDSPTSPDTVLAGQPSDAGPAPGSFASPLSAPAIVGLPSFLPSLVPMRFSRPPANISAPAPTVTTLQPDPPPGNTPSPGAGDGPGSVSDAPSQPSVPTKPIAIPEPPSLAALAAAIVCVALVRRRRPAKGLEEAA